MVGNTTLGKNGALKKAPPFLFSERIDPAKTLSEG